MKRDRRKEKREWTRENKRRKAWKTRRAAIVAKTDRVTHRYGGTHASNL